MQRLAREIADVHRQRPQRRFIISHGSGSFGHVLGQRHHIRSGVNDAAGWRGFAETGYVAGQLHRLMLGALLNAGLPVISFPPSAMFTCQDGEIIDGYFAPIRAAVAHGLIPVVFGDVAFDETLGGTIVSTEEVLAALADVFSPRHLTLAGLVDGVYDSDPLRNAVAQRLPELRLHDLEALGPALGDSHGVDVTGGMAAKVQAMAGLIHHHPDLQIHFLSGEIPDRLHTHLLDPERPLGTTLKR